MVQVVCNVSRMAGLALPEALPVSVEEHVASSCLNMRFAIVAVVEHAAVMVLLRALGPTRTVVVDVADKVSTYVVGVVPVVPKNQSFAAAWELSVRLSPLGRPSSGQPNDRRRNSEEIGLRPLPAMRYSQAGVISTPVDMNDPVLAWALKPSR